MRKTKQLKNHLFNCSGVQRLFKARYYPSFATACPVSNGKGYAGSRLKRQILTTEKNPE